MLSIITITPILQMFCVPRRGEAGAAWGLAACPRAAAVSIAHWALGPCSGEQRRNVPKAGGGTASGELWSSLPAAEQEK